MEGSEGVSGPPDSWELADLDESMSRLLASSSSSRKIPPPEFVDEVATPPPPVSAPVPSSESPSLQAAAVGQVDQFLMEALEKPRERLASKFMFVFTNLLSACVSKGLNFIMCID